MKPSLAALLKFVGAIAACVCCLLAAGAGAMWWFARDMYANTVILEAVAPDQKFKAVVFERDCGATTDFSTQVSILSAADVLSNESGNVFVADADHGRAPRGPGGGPDIRVSWRSDQRLRIAHHPSVRIFKSEPLKNGIEVEYVPNNPNG